MARSSITLFSAFAFLLLCAAVYYSSQFFIVQTLGDDHSDRAHRRLHFQRRRHPQTGELAAEATEMVGQDATDAAIGGAVRARRRPRRRRLRKAALTNESAASLDKATASLVAAKETKATAAGPHEQQPQAASDASASQQQQQAAAGSASAEGGCTRTRKPYHVVMTAASGNYQEWQSRIAYYHYKKQKALNPCSDMGGFTRLFNTPNARPDSLMDEIPTLLVRQLNHGSCAECDRGFIVMNRPWGVVQLVESELYQRIEEDYIFIIETDHMMMRVFPNLATPDRPVGFGFYYMLGMDPKLKPVVEKFLDPSISAETVDAVGPSPILIHKPLLQKVARPWWDMSQRMQKDPDAQRIFGWVLEMWGYNLAVRNMGIRHTVSKDIQVEPQGEGTDDMDTKYIYHYTFGLTPKPTVPGAAPWRLDKRQYYGGYPSDHLEMPPSCSAKSGFIISQMWNEAAQNIPGWKSKRPPRDARGEAPDLRSKLVSVTAVETPRGLADRLRGTGPWAWGQIGRLFFYARGVAYASPLGHPAPTLADVGRWVVDTASGTPVVKLTLCGAEYALRFSEPDEHRWTFTAVDAASRQAIDAVGVLSDRRQLATVTADDLPFLPGEPAARTRPPVDPKAQLLGGQPPGAPLVGDVAGTGPWFWAGSGPLSFMRGGVLITPWGEGVWGVKRSSGEEAPTDAIFADFAGSEHTVRMHNPGCLRMKSVRKADGDVVGIDYAATAALEQNNGRCKP